jgi:hypothetical protein
MYEVPGPYHVLLLVAFVVYWVPTIVAVVRRNHVPSVAPIVVINCFLGWTLIGWVVALVMACRSRR